MKTQTARHGSWLILLAIFNLTACTPKDNSPHIPSDSQYFLPAEKDVNAGILLPQTGVSNTAAIAPIEPATEKTTTASKIKVSLVDHEQLLAKIAEHKGQIVALDVWSNSCLPCLREFPHLVALSQLWPDRIRCMSLNVDYIGLKSKPPGSYTAKVETFVNAHKAEFENYQAAESDETIFSKLDIASIPAILIFGSDGKLHAKYTDDNGGEDGLTYQGDVIPGIEKLLAQP